MSKFEFETEQKIMDFIKSLEGKKIAYPICLKLNILRKELKRIGCK